MCQQPDRYIRVIKTNQMDALFTLSLFSQSTSTYFGHICIPSSGGILYVYIYITIGTCCAFQLIVYWPGQQTVN